MAFSWPIFLIVLILGVLQLVVGVVLGRCLTVGGSKIGPAEDGQHLRQLAVQVRGLVTSVAGKIGEHRQRVKQLGDRLAKVRDHEPARLKEAMFATVSQLLEINGELHERLAEAEKELQTQTAQVESHYVESRTDALTRLPNRRAFEDELHARLAQWKRWQSPFSLILLDIDHFKRLNDSQGHAGGDKALQSIAASLRPLMSEGCLVARIGGEEFALLLPGATGPAACTKAEQIRLQLGRVESRLEDECFRLTASLGAAEVLPGEDGPSLLRRADEALYAAKHAGRDAAFFHNGRTCQRIEPDDSIETGIQELCDDLRQRVVEVVKHGS